MPASLHSQRGGHHRALWLVIAAILLVIVPARVTAITIAEFNAGSSGNATGVFGQSVTTSARGPWNDIIFSFLDLAGQPSAVGTLFVLEAEYLGTPGDLDTSVAGYVAETGAIAGGAWMFAPDVRLEPLTRYFFYATTEFPYDSIAGASSDAGGQYYYSQGGGFDPAIAGPSADFRLAGSAVSVVAEPASLTLLGAGLFFVAAAHRWLRSHQARSAGGFR